MKKYIYAISLGILFSFSSCDLDTDPYSEITDKNNEGAGNGKTEYTTAQAIEGLLTDAYSDFASEFWQLDMYIMNDGQSDNAYAGESKDQTMQIDEFRLRSTNGTVKRDWEYLYKHITKTNSILKWAPLIEDPALTETRRKEIIAEASFMRALCYFNLVRIYGDVPLSLEEIPEINLDNIKELEHLIFPKKSSVADVYSQILIDMNVAVTDAPDYSANKFKVTKALANFIMAQIYATKDERENTNWTEVRKYARYVVDDTRYDLLDNYDDIFSVDGTHDDKGTLPTATLKNADSKESLFEVHYTSWNALGSWAAQMFYGLDWKKFNTPSRDLYRAFNLENDVVRRDASIRFLNVTGSWSDQNWSSSNYPFSFKLRAQEKMNIVLFRYAEAVLLLAEAENELNNLGEAEYQLNRIRTRAKLNGTTADTKEKMRLAIENEHRLEFAFEGKRWFDLKRRGRFIEVMKSCSDIQKTSAISNLNEHKLLWPLPQDEMDINENLTQNEGY